VMWAYHVDYGAQIMLNSTTLPGGASTGNGVHGAVVA
jgi:hypothetical protein